MHSNNNRQQRPRPRGLLRRSNKPAQLAPLFGAVPGHTHGGPLLLIVLAIIITALSAMPESAAHPMGSKMFGHRMIVTLAPEQIKLAYVVEIPTTKLVLMMDRFKKKHGFDRLGPAEEKAFNRDMLRHLASNIHLSIAGKSLPLKFDPNYAADQGAGDYRFFEYRLHLLADIGAQDRESFRFSITNDNFRMQRAVFYDAIKQLPGVYVTDASVPKHMGWEENDAYRTVYGVLNRGEGPSGVSLPGIVGSLGKGGGSQLLEMLKRHDLTMNVMLVVFLTAIVLGAAHALSPGHGKALVAAYLVGSRGTVWHAAALSIVVTISHVASVVILGAISLVAAQYVVPEYYMPFVSLGSGLLIVGIGVWLIVARARKKKHGHDHAVVRRDMGWKSLLALGISGGIVPCPSAMVVMLTAVAIGRIGFGFALICFFSIGLALSLMVVSILAVHAARFLDRFSRTQFLTRWLPLASAIAVTLLGLVIIYKGFWIEWFMWR